MNSSTNDSGDLDNFIINHPSFAKAKQEVLKCFENCGKSDTPRCISIVGPSGSGKSTVIKDFAKDFPVMETETGVKRPVLVVETPSSPTVKAMASSVLLALGDPLYSRGTEVQMTFRINQYLDKQDVRLIIFDEMQNLIDRDSKNLNCKAADWIKGLINSSKRPTIISGLEQIVELFLLNEQLRRRFRNPCFLEALDWADPEKRATLAGFLRSVQEKVQFEEGFQIYSSEMVYRFYCATRGLVAYIMDIIREAVDLAGNCHNPVVTLSHLAEAYVNVVCGNNLIGVNPFSHDAHEELQAALAVVEPSMATKTGTGKKKGGRNREVHK